MSYGYTKAFGSPTHEPMTQFHFDRDILHLDRATQWFDEHWMVSFNILCHSEHDVGSIHPNDLFRVRRLSLAAVTPNPDSLRRIANVLGLCGYGVKELFMTHWWLDDYIKAASPGYEEYNKKFIARGNAEHKGTGRSAIAEKRRVAPPKEKTARCENATEVARLVAKAVETKPNPAHRREPYVITPCQDMDWVYSEISRLKIRYKLHPDLTVVPWAFAPWPLEYWPEDYEMGKLPDAICMKPFQCWRRKNIYFNWAFPLATSNTDSTSSQEPGDEVTEMDGTLALQTAGNRFWGAHDEFMRTMLSAYIGVDMPNAAQAKEALKTAMANRTIRLASEHSKLLQEDQLQTQTESYLLRNNTEPFSISHPNWKHDVCERVLPVVKSVHVGTPWGMQHLEDCRGLCNDLMEELVPECKDKTGAERMHQFVMATRYREYWASLCRWGLDLRK